MTAVGGNIGQGVVKALRAGARDYVIVGTDMEPRSAGFSFVDRACVTPGAGDAPRLTRALIELIAAERLEAVFVCSPAELQYFSRARAELETATGTTILVNPMRVIEIGQDKFETARFLSSHGFLSPETVLAADDAAVDALVARRGFPLVAKPRRGWTSINVFTVHSLAELKAARVLVTDLVVQQHLPDASEEYTAGVVGSAADGAFAWIVLRRDLAQGTTYRTELVQEPAFGSQLVKMAQALGVEGSCNFQFRAVDGQPFVFEINPRFSGTSGIRYLYGFNDPELAFELARLRVPIRQPEVRPGVVLRYWNEVHLPDAGFATLRQREPFPSRAIVLP